MSTTTNKLKLIKLELTDAADITALNENWDKLDKHTHTADDISGILPIKNGGTGADNAKNARSNLGAQAQITYGTSEPIGGSNGDVYIQIVS
mgnify:CR=1 FL=1